MKNQVIPHQRTAVRPPSNLHAYALPCAVLVTSVVLAGWLGFHPHQSQPVVVLFAPGVSANQTLVASLAAGAHIVGLGVSANSLVVQSDDPNFFAQLRQQGAWLIADARGIVGCGSNKSAKYRQR